MVKKALIIIACIGLFFLSSQVYAQSNTGYNSLNGIQAPVPSDSIIGKVICGYQGWFTCYGDGSPVARWSHWAGGQYQSNNGKPAPGHLSFEMYPDISGYNSGSVFQTGFANFSDGTPSKLFSSYSKNVIDTHFVWMQRYGIDGVALQRFLGETFDKVFKAHRDSVAARVKKASEKYGRIFYLMYDVSGLDVTKFDSLKTDWQNTMLGKLKLTSSPQYAKQNGKPVVCIWGFGFTDRPGDATQCLAMINWFKSQGCYVIGGVPTNWRTSTNDSKPGFQNVYKVYDMISPWSVGRFGDATGADNFKTNYLVPDQTYCNNNGIKYQPVVFPGFAWSNWNGGAQNQIPRNKGEFLWRQLYNIKQTGSTSMYVAMFDEYDEGTAIIKAADSYYMLPTDQYFLTTSADGAYLSSDFYLRLVGKATRVIKSIDPLTTNVSIPFSVGPIFFRTGLEQKYDAMPNWNDSRDSSSGVIGTGGVGNPECSTVTETAHIGSHAIRYSGNDNSVTKSNCYFKVFDVNIPVSTSTRLSFWTYPQQNLARYVSIDLLLTDGTTLKNYNVIDNNGIPLKPGQARGTVNTWAQTQAQLGQWLNGKTIDRILIVYDHSAETGDFRGYIDDIAIYTDNSVTTSMEDPAMQYALDPFLYPNPAKDQVTIRTDQEINSLFITDLQGRVVYQNNDPFTGSKTIPVKNFSKGIYFISLQDNGINITKKLIIE